MIITHNVQQYTILREFYLGDELPSLWLLQLTLQVPAPWAGYFPL